MPATWRCWNTIVPVLQTILQSPAGLTLMAGDGHRMGMWVGAKMEVAPHCVNVHNMGSAIGVIPFLLLDVSGQRFMNEECSGQVLENQLTLLKDKTAWQFFDGGWKEQIPYMPAGHGACTKVLEEKDLAEGKCFDKLTPMDGFASQRFIDKTIEKGITFKADTLEELIEKIGLPKKQALNSIRRYNELARKGRDEDFGKSPSRMFALEKPPFYASKITPALLLCCHSGLESDEYAHCYERI
ncbi:MAG: FAD-binding protein [Oscillospiraceae bacterium]